MKAVKPTVNQMNLHSQEYAWIALKWIHRRLSMTAGELVTNFTLINTIKSDYHTGFYHMQL